MTDTPIRGPFTLWSLALMLVVLPGLIIGGLFFAGSLVDSDLAELEERVRTHPDESDGHRALATWLTENGSGDSALAEFRRAVDLAPDDGELRAHYALALLALDRSREAHGQALEGARLAPDNPLALATAAETSFRRGRYSECLAWLRKATDRSDAAPHLWALRAQVAFLTNRHAEAAWAFLRARSLDAGVDSRFEYPVNMAELERALREEAMFDSVATGRPPDTPFTVEDERGDSVSEARRDSEEASILARADLVRLHVARDSIILALGDTLPLGDLGLWGEERDGRRVDGIGPAVTIAPPGVLTLGRDGVFRAVARGRAVIRLEAVPPSRARPPGIARIEVPVIVRE